MYLYALDHRILSAKVRHSQKREEVHITRWNLWLESLNQTGFGVAERE